MRNCKICADEINRPAPAKYCVECSKLVAKRVAIKAAKTFKKKKEKTIYNYKKPKVESEPLRFQHRDTSCDGSGYF